MAAMNENAALRRRLFVERTIQTWTTRLEEAKQALVEYTENTPNPVDSRVQALRREIDRCKNNLDSFIEEREGRAPNMGISQRVPMSRRRSRSSSRSSSRGRSRSSSRGRSRSSSRSSSRGRSQNRGRGLMPPNRTRRRSRCPQGSNCAIS